MTSDIDQCDYQDRMKTNRKSNLVSKYVVENEGGKDVSNSRRLSGNLMLYDVHPTCVDKLRHPLRRDPDTCIVCASGGKNFAEAPQRDIAIDIQLTCKPEGPNAANGVARYLLHLTRRQEAGLCPKLIFVLSVVNSSIASGDDQNNLVAYAQRQRLGNLSWSDTERRGRHRDRSATRVCLDDRKIRGVLGEKLFDGLEAHDESCE